MRNSLLIDRLPIQTTLQYGISSAAAKDNWEITNLSLESWAIVVRTGSLAELV